MEINGCIVYLMKLKVGKENFELCYYFMGIMASEDTRSF